MPRPKPNIQCVPARGSVQGKWLGLINASMVNNPAGTGARRGLMGGQRRVLRGKTTSRTPPMAMYTQWRVPESTASGQAARTAGLDGVGGREEPESTGSPNPGAIDRTQQHSEARRGRREAALSVECVNVCVPPKGENLWRTPFSPWKHTHT